VLSRISARNPSSIAPSTSTSMPEMKDASSEIRNLTTRATSSGWP